MVTEVYGGGFFNQRETRVRVKLVQNTHDLKVIRHTREDLTFTRFVLLFQQLPLQK